MPSVTVTELIDRAKAISDMRDNFVTPSQWEHWATLERWALQSFIARHGWPLAFNTTDITVTGAETFYTWTMIPDLGVLAVVCVHQKDGENYRLLRHQSVVDFNQDTTRVGGAREYRVAQSIDGVALQFYPNAKAGEVYRVTYLTPGQKLRISDTLGGTAALSVNYPMGWEERIVLGMARRALMKEESDTRTIDQEIAIWDQRIEEGCWNRVLSDVPRVRNVDETVYGWSDRYSIPPYNLWSFL